MHGRRRWLAGEVVARALQTGADVVGEIGFGFAISTLLAIVLLLPLRRR
jgi:hypothetical protein